MTFQEVWDILSVNQQFQGDCPDGIDAPLDGKEKGAICGFVVKKLTDIEKVKGRDFVMEMLADHTGQPAGLARVLKGFDFFVRGNDGQLIRSFGMLTKTISFSRGRTEKRLGKSLLVELSQGISFKKAS